MAHHHQPCETLNHPEENDETLSDFDSDLTRLPNLNTRPDHFLNLHRMMEGQPFIRHRHPTIHKLPQSHSQDRFYRNPLPQTPYPSQVDPCHDAPLTWHYPSYQSGECHPSSLPSYLPFTEFQSFPGVATCFPSGPRSLPGGSGGGGPNLSLSSLELPGSLHSVPPAPLMHACHASHCPHPSPVTPCCGPYGPVPLRLGPHAHPDPGPAYQLPYRLTGLEHHRHTPTGSTESGQRHVSPRPRQKSPCRTHLPQEQRKVFVTYEEDSEEHFKEIIKFVSLLRNNGFDTHIDVFEQQLNSISKIDCMERYLNEKDYLIIIIISLKYFETVTGAGANTDCDERTSDTVYIHKQLQNEFIQNGCKNFRFIPILFPGAKKSYVPSWLQNTHVYSWPRDRDDILRRLMRVEKYNPPPIGQLPTIISVPI